METKTLKYAEILELSVKAEPEFLQLMKQQLGLREKADTARDSYRENIPFAGKLMCVSKVRFETGQKAGAIPSSAKFKDYFKGVFGKDYDTRTYACCQTYASFVLTAKFSEEAYDGNPVDALQRASRIVSAVNLDLNHPAVAEVAALLPKLDTKKLKKLDRIQKRIQTKTVGEGDKAVETVVFITEEELDKQLANPGILDVSEMAASLCKSPTGLGACIAELVATGRTTETPETARALSHLLVTLAIALSENVDTAKARRYSQAQLEAWGREVSGEPIKLIPAPETPEAEAPVESGAPAKETKSQRKARKSREAEAAAKANTVTDADRALLKELEAPVETAPEVTEPVAEVAPAEVTMPEPEMAPVS